MEITLSSQMSDLLYNKSVVIRKVGMRMIIYIFPYKIYLFDCDLGAKSIKTISIQGVS